MDREDSVAASRDQDARPQTEANASATPSDVTSAELLRALTNMNAALGAAMDDEARPVFWRKIVATKNATVELIERAGGSTSLIRIVRATEGGSQHAGEPREDAQRRATPDLPQGDA